MRTKTTSLRLPEQQAAELAAVARADGMTASAAMRRAVDQYIAARRTDPAFQERLAAVLEENRRVLERLSNG